MNKKKLLVFDIETLKSIFCVVFKDISNKKYYTFEISIRKNQVKELIHFLKNNVSGLIGYNNLFFDYPILHYILENELKFIKLDSIELVDLIYNKAQYIINSENTYPSIPEWKVKIPQMDLFKIWHFDNKAKMTSLKKIEFAIRLNNVQDMPYDHSDILTKEEEFEEVLNYCINDVDATYEFYLITRGKTELPLYKNKDKIQLRLDILKKTGLNCINWNDVKIGDEINKSNYLKNTGLSWEDIKGKNTIRDKINFNDCIADFIKFESVELNNFLNRLRKISVSGTKAEFSEKITYKGVTFTFAQGGIHTVDKARLITIKDNEILEDRDVASMYPRTIITQKLFPKHLGIEWLTGYIWTHDERIINKELSDSNKHPELSEEDRRSHLAISEAFKLSLNGGGYGKTGEEFSWQHDILVMLKTTIANQLALLMLAEKYLDNNMKVISANTDGIVLLYNKDQKELVEEIDKEWQKITMYNLEYTEYIKFIQTSVNDYISLKPDGKLKFKGDFEIDKEIHKNHSMKIVPMALKEYYINNISIEETILQNNDILNFCKCANMIGNNYLVERTYDKFGDIINIPLSKITRYFVSNNGNSLIKILPPLEKQDFIENSRKEGQLSLFDFVDDVKKDTNRETNIEAGYYNTVFNKIELKDNIKDYNINYNYYFNECYKIIKKIKMYN